MPYRHWLRRLAEERLLIVLALAAVALWSLRPVPVYEIIGFIHAETIATLAGLLVLVRALEMSGALLALGQWLLQRLRSPLALASVLTAFAAVLAMFVTNDVALFIVVPLILTLRCLPLEVQGRLVVFAALAVNVGSALTPIGNPQNLYLWRRFEVDFAEFVMAMAPLVLTLFLALAVLVWLAFRGASSLVYAPPLSAGKAQMRVGWRQAALAVLGMIALVAATEMGLGVATSIVLIALMAIARPAVLRGVDWLLLLVFALMFVVMGMLARLAVVQDAMHPLLHLPLGAFFAAVLSSQVVSNVPATILLVPFIDCDWPSLAWGVTVGGFGTAVGSLANLIAMRLGRSVARWNQFYRWSLLMWLLGMGIGWGLLAKG